MSFGIYTYSHLLQRHKICQFEICFFPTKTFVTFGALIYSLVCWTLFFYSFFVPFFSMYTYSLSCIHLKSHWFTINFGTSFLPYVIKMQPLFGVISLFLCRGLLKINLFNISVINIFKENDKQGKLQLSVKEYFVRPNTT